MVRSKKYKLALLANLNKKKVSCDEKSNIERTGNVTYVKCKKIKVAKQTIEKEFKVNESDFCADISYENVAKPLKKEMKNAFINSKNESGIQKLPSSKSRFEKVQKICISGNFNQGNIERYGYFAGKQCVANSLLCIIYRKIMNFRLWTSSTLDKILDLGNEYYQYLQSQPNIEHDYIMVSELIRTVEVENKFFELEISENSEVGVIDAANYVAPDLYNSFQTCLSAYESCFVTFNGNTFAIMKQGDSYFVFDSHSRSNLGLLSEDGSSILIEYKSIDDLYVHCLNLSVSMNSSQLEQYEITGINVIMMGNEVSKSVNDFDSIDIDDPIKSQNQSDEVFITDVETNDFIFNPLRSAKRKELCNLMNKPVDNLHNVNVPEIYKLTKPSEITEIKGDANG